MVYSFLLWTNMFDYHVCKQENTIQEDTSSIAMAIPKHRCQSAISRRTGCGRTSHQQVPLPCKTKDLHLEGRVGTNSPASCLTSATDRETRGLHKFDAPPTTCIPYAYRIIKMCINMRVYIYICILYIHVKYVCVDK